VKIAIRQQITVETERYTYLASGNEIDFRLEKWLVDVTPPVTMPMVA